MRRFTITLTLIALAFAPALQARAQEALLIQDSEPWGADAWQQELTAAGISYTEITSADLATVTLSDYRMVITSSVQGSTYNTNIMAAFTDFEDYVTDGGVLLWSGCTQSGETPYPDPPFGGTNEYDYITSANVDDPTHPITASVPDPATGNGVAHNYFVDEPVGAEILMSNPDNGEPVLYVFESGSGQVVVSGLTWEYGWDNGQDNASALVDGIDWGWFDVACDQDGDGYLDAACGGDDCDDDDIDINPGADEARDAVDQDCDGYYDEGLLVEGDLLVTEIMKDPSAVADEFGEWFEIFNTTGIDINLIGGTIYDLDGALFTVESDLWIPAGGYAVLNRNGDDALNGGVTTDYEYGEWFLANNTDEIELEHFGAVLDTVVYADADGWPDTSGESMSLDIDAYDAALNDDAASWCGGQDIFGQGDLGTPGDVNPDCCPDADGDGYQDADCGGEDCDDTNSLVNPAATEVCNEVDDDCDGDVDEELATTVWYPDADGDGYGDATDPGTESCLVLADHVDNDLDCDDTDAAVNPDAIEYCDLIDNDCDGVIDEDDAADALTFYEDADGDGFGNLGSTTLACDQPDGYVTDTTDCDDTNAAINPDATEVCNGADDDCDGTVDEADAADASTWYADVDGDGYGDPTVSQVACDQPPDFVLNDQDCEPADANQ